MKMMKKYISKNEEEKKMKNEFAKNAKKVQTGGKDGCNSNEKFL